MQSLLVTGASGLLGSNIVLSAPQNISVTAVVHTRSMPFENAEVLKVDLTAFDGVRSLFSDVQPTWVIHCAADTAIDELESDVERANRLNREMARDVARAAGEFQSHVLFVSTDSVFDGSAGPYCEDDHPDPQNVYARSKLEGEQAVAEVLPTALIVRTNLFGWSPGTKRSLAEWFHSRLERGEVCPGFTDIYFSPIYAPELTRIFIQMLERGLEGLYHVPGADCVNKYEFGVRLAREFGFDPDLVEPTESTTRHWGANRPRRTCLDGSKIKQELGFDLPNLNEGLGQFRTDREKLISRGFEVESNREGKDA
jgi:dTDP-4-dehydrorhamnose reductase